MLDSLEPDFKLDRNCLSLDIYGGGWYKDFCAGLVLWQGNVFEERVERTRLHNCGQWTVGVNP